MKRTLPTGQSGFVVGEADRRTQFGGEGGGLVSRMALWFNEVMLAQMFITLLYNIAKSKISTANRFQIVMYNRQ